MGWLSDTVNAVTSVPKAAATAPATLIVSAADATPLHYATDPLIGNTPLALILPDNLKYVAQDGRYWDANGPGQFTCQGAAGSLTTVPNYCLFKEQSAVEEYCDREPSCEGYVYDSSDKSMVNFQATNNVGRDIGPSGGKFMKRRKAAWVTEAQVGVQTGADFVSTPVDYVSDATGIPDPGQIALGAAAIVTAPIDIVNDIVINQRLPDSTRYKTQSGRWWDSMPPGGYTCPGARGSTATDYCIFSRQADAEEWCDSDDRCQGYVYRPSAPSGIQCTINPKPDMGPEDGTFMKKESGYLPADFPISTPISPGLPVGPGIGLTPPIPLPIALPGTSTSGGGDSSSSRTPQDSERYRFSGGRAWDLNPAGAYTCAGSQNPDYCILGSRADAERSCDADPNCLGFHYRTMETSPTYQLTNNPGANVGPDDGVFMRKVAAATSAKTSPGTSTTTTTTSKKKGFLGLDNQTLLILAIGGGVAGVLLLVLLMD